jgi:phosphoribosylaminoimidazolecarboxamide formyltransferase/IMP cyclohydrolase
LLAVREISEHLAAMEAHGIKPVDLLVVNLYPFEQVVAEQGVTLDTANENIDIGGPAMIRSAAKNHRYITVVVEPGQYELVMRDMNGTGGATTLDLRQKLKVVAFARTAAYDQVIASFFSRHY